METMLALLSAVFCGLLGMVFVPSRFANAVTGRLRNLVTLVVLLEFLLAMSLLVGYAVSGRSPAIWSLFQGAHGAGISFYYDGATSLMLLLVSFIGVVVCRFSVRYLDGEESQGGYFRFLGFTIGAVSLLVVAGNLLLFIAAWVMTSVGLHQLLLHYGHRPAAQRAAWTKFVISRMGDALLVAALLLVFRSFGTCDFSRLFSAAETLATSPSIGPMHSAIAWLLILGAVTKSAQFPFHTWLPETMETPTPVSALMHAGIVNAGGYLIIRLSPLVTLAPAALTMLALIGAITACFAAVVMMTQPSVKRMLAYSTIAQMGFMMLQCGLGAFSAAMLHILAHSLYKAHAFLSSGSVVAQAMSLRGAKSPSRTLRTSASALLLAAVVTLSAYFSITSMAGLHIVSKPGGVVLAVILCLALITWGWRMLSLSSGRTFVLAATGITGMCLAYLGCYLAVDSWLPPTSASAFNSTSLPLVAALCVLVFGLLFGLHAFVYQTRTPAWLNSFRVHASNGFYIDALYQRVFSPLKNT